MNWKVYSMFEIKKISHLLQLNSWTILNTKKYNGQQINLLQIRKYHGEILGVQQYFHTKNLKTVKYVKHILKCFRLYIYIYWSKLLVYFIWVWATFLFGRKKSFRPKFQSHLITIYVCLIAYRKRLVVV
jgi:hypothetical protein